MRWSTLRRVGRAHGMMYKMILASAPILRRDGVYHRRSAQIVGLNKRREQLMCIIEICRIMTTVGEPANMLNYHKTMAQRALLRFTHCTISLLDAFNESQIGVALLYLSSSAPASFIPEASTHPMILQEYSYSRMPHHEAQHHGFFVFQASFISP